MSLLPEDATYAERVQDCFLSHQGAGLMLSPLDTALVREWAERGIPFEAVQRGIAVAAELAAQDAPRGRPALRSLRACKKQVEAEARRVLSLTAGAASPLVARDADDADPWRLAFLRNELRALSALRPELGGVTDRLVSGILARPPSGAEEASRRGDVVAITLLRELPFGERLAVLRAVRARVPPGILSSRARVRTRRVQRSRVVGEWLGLSVL